MASIGNLHPDGVNWEPAPRWCQLGTCTQMASIGILNPDGVKLKLTDPDGVSFHLGRQDPRLRTMRRSARIAKTELYATVQLDIDLDSGYIPKHSQDEQLLDAHLHSMLTSQPMNWAGRYPAQTSPIFQLNSDLWGQVFRSLCHGAISSGSSNMFVILRSIIHRDILPTLRAFACTHAVFHALLRPDGPLGTFMLIALAWASSHLAPCRLEFGCDPSGFVRQTLHLLRRRTMVYASGIHMLMAARHVRCEQPMRCLHRGRNGSVDISVFQRSLARVDSPYLRCGLRDERPTLLYLSDFDFQSLRCQLCARGRWTNVRVGVCPSTPPTLHLHDIQPESAIDLFGPLVSISGAPIVGTASFVLPVRSADALDTGFDDHEFSIDPRGEHLIGYEISDEDTLIGITSFAPNRIDTKQPGFPNPSLAGNVLHIPCLDADRTDPIVSPAVCVKQWYIDDTICSRGI